MKMKPDLTKTEEEKNILHKAHKTIDEIEDKFVKFGQKKWCFLYDINQRKIEKIELYTSLIRHDGDLIEVLKELKIANYIDLCKTIESNPELQELQKYFRQKLIKRAERVVIDTLSVDNEKVRLNAAMFILRTVGKDFGWSESPLVNVDQRQISKEDARKQILEIFGMNEPEAIDVSEESAGDADESI